MSPLEHHVNALSRRSFLGLTGLGLGAIAARSLITRVTNHYNLQEWLRLVGA